MVPEQIDIPPLLLQPYVENAIWHGLMQKKTNGRLWVQGFRIGPDLGIEIQDDGVGRKAAAELKANRRAAKIAWNCRYRRAAGVDPPAFWRGRPDRYNRFVRLRGAPAAPG
ncbi:MAG: hypothetical protein IPH16_17075 [Haliscomenobacter sp.]|nr:hypothetical protein [Haliscomenobacter sp.]